MREYGYQYKANRYSLISFAKINIFDFHGFMPYALVGLGFSWNHFADYQDGAAAADGLSLRFANATTPQFAYELGAGLDYKISTHWWASFGLNQLKHI